MAAQERTQALPVTVTCPCHGSRFDVTSGGYYLVRPKSRTRVMRSRSMGKGSRSEPDASPSGACPVGSIDSAVRQRIGRRPVGRFIAR